MHRIQSLNAMIPPPQTKIHKQTQEHMFLRILYTLDFIGNIFFLQSSTVSEEGKPE